MTTIALPQQRPGLFGFSPFSPSGARPASGGLAANWIAELLLNTTLGLAGLFPFPSVAVALPVQAPAAHAVPEARPAVLRSQEMAEAITGRLGFPVSALASVLDVQRKTVYDWLGGSEAQPSNAERLRVLHDAFAGEDDGSFLFYHRFWKRELSEGESLQAVLMDPSSKTAGIRAALDELRPAVGDALASYARRKAVSSENPGPADHLAEYLDAGDRA